METPLEISEKRIILAEEYSRLSDRLMELVREQALYFNANRSAHKSDTSVQRAFDVTDRGIEMTGIKLRLKSIEKSMSALNTHLRLLDNQAHNLY